MIKRNISKAWGAMNDEEKAPYFEEANAAKESNKRQFCEDTTKKTRKRAKTEEHTINTRVSLPAIKETVINLTEDKKEAVKGMGFGGLLELNCHQLDRELCGWLVRNFDPNDYSLNVHGRKLTITTIDVENIMGLRSEGSLVNAEGSNEDEDISELCNKYGFVNGRLKVSQLREDLASSVDAGEEFRVRFALLALSCMCCPNTKDGIKASLMHILKDPSSLGTINWARFLLDKLGIAVKNYKKKKIAGGYVGGCVFFLMIFYFEHFVPVGAPMATLDTQSSPRLRFWGNAEIKGRCRFIYAKGLLSKEKDLCASTRCIFKGQVMTYDFHYNIATIHSNEIGSPGDTGWAFSFFLIQIYLTFILETKGIAVGCYCKSSIRLWQLLLNSVWYCLLFDINFYDDKYSFFADQHSFPMLGALQEI